MYDNYIMRSKKFLKNFEQGNLQIFGGFDNLFKTYLTKALADNPMDYVSGII